MLKRIAAPSADRRETVGILAAPPVSSSRRSTAPQESRFDRGRGAFFSATIPCRAMPFAAPARRPAAHGAFSFEPDDETRAASKRSQRREYRVFARDEIDDFLTSQFLLHNRLTKCCTIMRNVTRDVGAQSRRSACRRPGFDR